VSSPPRISPEDLFAAAREEAPSSVVRDQVWGRVAAVTAAPAAAAVVKVAVPTATKLLATGALIGALGMGAIVVALSSFGDARRSAPAPILTTVSTDRAIAPPPVAPDDRPLSTPTPLADSAPRGRVSSSAPVPAPHPTASTAKPTEGDSASALAEEARLVTDARAALLRSEPEQALSLARKARRLPSKMLEPEELALEIRALRALGRTDEALATELTLRSRFPDHALSR
jgi:hypothetical protein